MGNSMARNRRGAWIAVGMVLLLATATLLSGCYDGPRPGHSKSSSTAAVVPDNLKELEPVVLMSADSTAPGSAGYLWQVAFKEKVEQLSGGKLVIDYHGNGELGSDADLVTQLQNDEIQIDVAQPAALVSFVPGLAVLDSHMAFATYNSETIDKVLNGNNAFSKRLQKGAESKGIHVLGWLQNATYRQVTSNKKLETLEDYRGFKIRTMQNANHMAFWTAIGAEPTPLAFADVYNALENGSVEGQENATDTCVGNNFQEVQKYLALTNHVLYANVMTINEECWKSLEPEYRDILKRALARATAEVAPKLKELDMESRKTLTDAGMELIEYDDSFFQAVQENPNVKKLNEDIDEQAGGLLTVLRGELDKAAR